MLDDTAHELIAEFDGTKQLRPDVQKPLWHQSRFAYLMVNHYRMTNG